MKALIFSDLQLEAGQSLGYGEHGPGSRFDDQVQVLARIALVAEREQVDVVLNAGDTFDRPKPSPWAILAYQKFCMDIIELGLPMVTIPGNHDVKSAALPSIMEAFVEQSLYSPQPMTYYVGGATVMTLPWAPPASLAAADPGTDRDELNARTALVLADQLAQFAAKAAPGPRILLGHWCVSGAMLRDGAQVESYLREPIVPLEALTEAGFDLVAFGHIHRMQVLASDPPVIYTGTPAVNNWGETSQPHGVWVYDSDGPELRFVEITDRPFLTLVGAAELGRALTERADTLQGAVVRYQFTATESEIRAFDERKLRDDLLACGAHKVFVQATITKEARARASEASEELGPVQGFDLWLGVADVDPALVGRARDEHVRYLERL